MIKFRTLFPLFYIVSLVISFTSEIANIPVSIYIRYGISFFWCLILLFNVLAKKNNQNEKNIIYYTSIFIIPFVFIFLFTLILRLLKLDIQMMYFTRLCSSVLFFCLSIMLPAVGTYFFGKRIISYVFLGMCISYFTFSFIPFLLKDSLLNFLISLLQFKEYSNYYLEVHDLTLASGMTFLYFLFFEDKKTKFHKTKIFLNVLLLLLGFKRIVFLSIAFIVIANFFIKRIKKMNNKALIVCSFSILLSFTFIYFVDSGLLFNIVNDFGIDTSGRIEMYTFAANYFDFSFLYSGMGYARFTKMFETLYLEGFAINGHRVAASIHSDILSLYIELGFIGFAALISYYSYFRFVILNKKFGNKSAYLYLMLTLYLFLLLLTDNVFTYFVFQCVYFTLPIGLHLIDRKETKEKVLRIDNEMFLFDRCI